MSLTLFARFKKDTIRLEFPEGDKSRWTDVVTVLEKKALVISDAAWAFEYYDDEGDFVMGKSEAEWQAALASAAAKNSDSLVFHMEVFPLGHYEHRTDARGLEQGLENLTVEQDAGKKCASNQKSCCSAPCQKPQAEQPPTSSCCPEQANQKPCCFPCKRPIPDAPLPDDNKEPPQRIDNPTLLQYKYTGEALRAVALPLGPIGQGNIAVAGDGGLRQWQISNKVSHNGMVPDSFFAIRVDSGSETKSVVLQSNALYDESGFTPATYITDHFVPGASIQLLKDLPGVETVEVTAKYPVVEVDYASDNLPLPVKLTAFNPKVPLVSLDSAIPFLALEFTVTNTTKSPVQVTMLGTLQNIAGWNGTENIANEVSASGYGGNVNSLYTSSDQFGIDMSNPTMDPKHAFNGHVALTVLKEVGDETSCMLQFDSAKELWAYFTSTGLPGQGKVGPSPAGSTWNGAVANKRELLPGKSTTFTYFLGWRFPNRYRDWQLFESIPNTDIYLGNQYNKHWKTVTEVLEYACSNYERLRDTTFKFRDAMFNSTLPPQLIDSAAGRISVLNSTSCMWHEDDYFYAFEGCRTDSGCCPLNCTHVWNYEMCLSRMYPDLERKMREIDLLHQINPYGVIPSRSSCPLEVRRIWTVWPDYTQPNSSTNICCDGEIGTVLKAYREFRQGAPKDWFAGIWNPVKMIMKRWMNELDDGTGLIKGPQPNTYDTTMYGVNTFIGCLYLCALRATEEMAKLQGDTGLAGLCHDRFALGSANLDKACFVNGKWYTQQVDPKHAVELVSDSTFVDGLYGQWWAHSLGLGYLLPKDHIQSSLKHTFMRNYVESFDPAAQAPRHFFDRRDSGLVICSWDEEPPANRLLYSTECAWSGILYSFIGLCLYEDQTEIALKALMDVRNCYDGTRRSPWNEIECGDHYTRPMSGFILMEIAAGQTWTLEQDGSVHLGFAPVIGGEFFRGFFLIGSGWGQYSQIETDCVTAELSIAYGSVDLASFSVGRPSDRVSVLLDDNTITAHQMVKNGDGNSTKVVFDNVLRVGANQKLTVKLF